MSDRRVVITGLGVVSAAGLGADALFDAQCTAASRVGPIAGFDASGFACRVAGEIAGFSARDFVPKSYRKAVKLMARDIELAVIAADLAVRDAGLVTAGVDAQNINIDGGRFACNIGAGLICADMAELGAAMATALGPDGRLDLRRWGAEGINNLTPLWLLKYLPNMLACHVTIIHDLRGPSNTITCGEASAHLSIGEAWHQIQRGAADWAIAGGAESKLNPMGLLRQGQLNRLATGGNDRPDQACRPFDAHADGTVIGEGGGLMILETLDIARQRGARIYAELAGFAAANDPAACDPDHATSGHVGQAARRALAEAGVAPAELGLVVAHGSGVPAEDRLEEADLAELLGSAPVPVTTPSAMVGNCFAGAGGIGVGVACLALHRQIAPPAINCPTPFAGCRLTLPARAQAADIRAVLVQGFSHMGNSAALVLKRFTE